MPPYLSASPLWFVPHRPSPPQAVNVAQVPHRSVFRYAGGKTWFVPQARMWLRAVRPNRLVEPFAGGAIVGLTAAFEDLAQTVHLVEKDDDVAAVWQVVTNGHAEALAERVERFAMTTEALDAALAHSPTGVLDHAFQTILRNRVNRGGILAPGAGRIKAGENGRGLASRWYPATLAKRLRALGNLPPSRLTFHHGDAFEAFERYGSDPGTAWFIDPPYTAGGKKAGTRLYAHHALDHERLFAVAAACAGPVLMTYDDAPEVAALAQRFGLETARVPMKSTHHARTWELVAGRQLGVLGALRTG